MIKSRISRIRVTYPLISNFYVEKLGYVGVSLFFLIFGPRHRLWVLVRTVLAIYVLSKNIKNITKIFLVNFSIFTAECIYPSGLSLSRSFSKLYCSAQVFVVLH